MNVIKNSTTEKIEPSSSTFVLVLLLGLKCICLVCGVLGNLGVIIYNVYNAYNRTQTSYFVVNLAFADFLACLTIYIPHIAEFVKILLDIESNETFFCKFTYTAGSLFVCVSTLTLLAITVDRYLYIKFPLKYPAMMTWRRTYTILLGTWITAWAFALLQMFNTQPSKIRTICSTNEIAVILTFVFVYISVPLALIFYFNFKIFKLAREKARTDCTGNVIRNNARASNSSAVTFTNNVRFRIQRELKTIKTFAIIVGVFIMCLIPFATTIVLGLICDCVPTLVYVLSTDFMAANSVLNPYIYSLRQRKYKNCSRQLLSAIWHRQTSGATCIITSRNV